MDATNEGRTHQKFLLRFVLLLTLSSACCQELDSSACVLEDSESYGVLTCTNITAFSAVNSSILTRSNFSRFSLKINNSPGFVLKREDFEKPSFDGWEELYFERNALTSFNSEAIRGLHALRSLYLDENNLTEIQAGAFSGLPLLKGLVLSYNQIESIQPDAFAGLGDVRFLSLCYNKLKALDETTFLGLINLGYLDISGNEIVTIDYRTFQTLHQLVVILSHGNRLEEFDIRTFEHNPLVQILTLSGCNFENISNVQLNIPTLEDLTLGTSRIQNIPMGFFNRLPNLQDIYLGYNELTTIEPGVFAPLPNLEVLHIGYNNLTSLSVASFAQFERILKEMFVKEGEYRGGKYRLTVNPNPWDCTTTDMMELRTWFDQHQYKFDAFFVCNQTQTE